MPLEVLEQLSANTKLYKVILENYPSLLSCRSSSDNRLHKLHDIAESDPTRVPVTVSMKLKKNAVKVEENNEKSPTQQRSKRLVHQVHFNNRLQISNSFFNTVLFLAISSHTQKRTANPREKIIFGSRCIKGTT